MTTRPATCGFCGLLCDDLEVEVRERHVKLVRNGCDRSHAAYAALGAATLAAEPAIKGKAATLERALEEAVRILHTARRPLISGLDIDIEGTRATLALARKLGAVLDHANSQTKYHNLHVLQESGWITTTLGEARNRADLVLLIGDGWHRRYPRFIERIVAPSNTLFAENLKRRVITLTPLNHDTRMALPAEVERIELNMPLDRLPVLLTWLNAMIQDKPLSADRLSGIPASTLLKCKDWIGAAQYGVIAWTAADLEIPHAELAVQALSRLLRTLNLKSRFAGLPLAGTDADLTSNAVITWQSGLSFPLSFANGGVDFDVHRYAHQNVLARNEADALLWVSSLSGQVAALPKSLPVIMLGRADLKFSDAPDVFIPVATPGIDAAGHLVRTDKVVTMQLPKLRESALPSVATVIKSMHDRWLSSKQNAH